MLIPNQMIEIKWSRKNCTYYKELGYKFTQIGDKFIVHAEDLTRGSSAYVQVKCDECGTICTTMYKSYIESLELHPNKYFCRSCSQKQKSTREKIEKSCLDKYGNTNMFRTCYYKNKSKQTNLEHLGVEYPMQSPSVQEKSKQTIYNKGELFGFQNKERRIKAQKTLSKLGKVNTSSQQLELFKALSNKYQCVLNKSLSNLSLDIELNFNGVKCDIEIDGEYWHQDKDKDRRRDEVVKSYGYKILRIRINHKLPDIEQIIDGIEKLISSEHSFYQIVAEDCKYSYNNI